MTEIFTRKIPFPSYSKKTKKTGKKSTALCTVNTIPSWYRWSGTKIKNQFKQDLADMYIPEPEEMYSHLTVQYRIIRDSKRRIDSDSAALVLKWFNDHLEASGYIKDDTNINLQAFPTVIDNTQCETMIEIKLLNKKQKW